MSQLYLISPPEINDLAGFAILLEKLLAKNIVSIFQLRLKNQTQSKAAKYVAKLLPVCQKYHTEFFINDFYELARYYPVSGIHLGQNDAQLQQVKAEFNQQLKIGISCQNSLKLAKQAQAAGADYVSFGSCFPTKTKLDTVPVTHDIFAKWRQISNLPQAAIGGIDFSNIEKILFYKPDYICMISAIWSYPAGPEAALEKFGKLTTKNGKW